MSVSRHFRLLFVCQQGIFWPLLLACGAFLLLHARSLIGPVIFYDDFQVLAPARTWQRTYESLWVPHNEHTMPLGRLFCFALSPTAGKLPLLPYFTCLVGPGALLLAVLLLYVFVRRELGHPFYSLLAVILFAVTSVYHQAVWWFTASFVILSLDTMLMGLLAAQNWRQTGRGRYLLLVVMACLLAPAWFALGILAGPLCTLYLLPASFSRKSQENGVSLSRNEKRARLRLAAKQISIGLLPLAGTALFLALSLPRTAEAILHTSHYGEQTAVQAFHPLIGLEYTARSMVDNLLLGLVGVTNVALPRWGIAAILPLIVGLAVWWWHQARDRRIMLLGLGLIGSSYLLCYSARALWDYQDMVHPAFSRYHLLPHLGLVLFICGGLPAYADRWFSLDGAGAITASQRRFIFGLIAVCFVVQLPRGLSCSSPTGWDQFAVVRQQQAYLRHIEEVDSLCHQYHISAVDARPVLGRLNVPLSWDVMDGWDFLVGSDDPRPLAPEEVRRLLVGP